MHRVRVQYAVASAILSCAARYDDGARLRGWTTAHCLPVTSNACAQPKRKSQQRKACALTYLLRCVAECVVERELLASLAGPTPDFNACCARVDEHTLGAIV